MEQPPAPRRGHAASTFEQTCCGASCHKFELDPTEPQLTWLDHPVGPYSTRPIPWRSSLSNCLPHLLHVWMSTIVVGTSDDNKNGATSSS
ncbi:hypothetical protein CRG98_038198 [Punica granatum]|uniref:Uncharacterized protein n=1 Tax=Punica granatum TaxID=22663 RepID=A0A2I0IDF6_PUNGR|nr:hypothetical protein CRG98_038198 [Punica granatum]